MMLRKLITTIGVIMFAIMLLVILAVAARNNPENRDFERAYEALSRDIGSRVSVAGGGIGMMDDIRGDWSQRIMVHVTFGDGSQGWYWSDVVKVLGR